MMAQLHDALVEYDFEGGRYSFTIPCESADEARAKVEAIRRSSRFLGWPCFTVSANPVTLPFGAAWAWLRAWLFDRNGRRGA